MKPVNGIKSWVETHHEVVTAIVLEDNKNIPTGKVAEVSSTRGTGGLYELGEELTDEFEELNKGRQWDGEFFDEIEDFLNEKLS